ncbi:MAG: hypothetical protein LBN09_07930 [Clostridioides sp.]|jgi:hypothetical protein|nr:hypothetical protein [Clostridioides sp.]
MVVVDLIDEADISRKDSSIVLDADNLRAKYNVVPKYKNYIRGIDDFYEYVINDN